MCDGVYAATGIAYIGRIRQIAPCYLNAWFTFKSLVVDRRQVKYSDSVTLFQ